MNSSLCVVNAGGVTGLTYRIFSLYTIDSRVSYDKIYANTMFAAKSGGRVKGL